MYIRHSDKEVGDSTAKVVNSEQITTVLLLVVLLHRHNGAHGICDILAAPVLEGPLMHVVGNDIPPCLAFHGRATGSCVTCCILHIFTFLLFNHSQLST